MIDRQSMNEKPVVHSFLTWAFVHADTRYCLEPRYGIYNSKCFISWNHSGSGDSHVKHQFRKHTHLVCVLFPIFIPDSTDLQISRSIFMTHVLFEIALLSPEDVESMRSEIKEALESEGGDWNKASLLNMRKIDSAFREVGRLYALGYGEFFRSSMPVYPFNTLSEALTRYAMVGYDLQDGTYIPPGSKVAIDLKRIHFNPQIYPNPERRDLFRFSKLREKEGTDIKYGFATLDPNVGRFLSLHFVTIYLELFLFFYLSTFCLVLVRQIHRDHTSRENNFNHWDWRSSRLSWSILCCRQLLCLLIDLMIHLFIYSN